MIADKWIEYKPIYETQEHSFCSVCHLDLTANNIVPWKHAEEHMLNGEAGGHYTDSVLVQVGTEEIVHEAVYEKDGLWINLHGMKRYPLDSNVNVVQLNKFVALNFRF